MVIDDNIGDDCAGLGIGAFLGRHLGPRSSDIKEMLSFCGFNDLSEFVASVLPEEIREKKPLQLTDFDEALTEEAALQRLRAYAAQNKVYRSYLGLGFYQSLLPSVIRRNVVENPAWYTHYTPYQAEVSQGRLEALFIFQTMITELTGLGVANASLLDEASAAAEALTMALAISKKRGLGNCKRFIITAGCFPQTIAVLKTRAEALGVELVIVSADQIPAVRDAFGVIFQYPEASGGISDIGTILEYCRKSGLVSIVAADPLALMLLRSPGDLRADIAIGSCQRFGMPMGAGGPAAAYIAVGLEYQRLLPGRLVGLSKDAAGRPAYRLALQTREQHIRREKATSNICTAQVLPAIIAAFFAVYHGPDGLREMAGRVNLLARILASALRNAGFHLETDCFFDTLLVRHCPECIAAVEGRARAAQVNIRVVDRERICVAVDQACSDEDLAKLIWIFTGSVDSDDTDSVLSDLPDSIPEKLRRKDNFLSQAVFNSYHSETEFLRFIRRLEERDLSLATAMIPLGSCTMKLNPTSAMLPLSWSSFADIHPFVPSEQLAGYFKVFSEVERALSQITGFAAVTFQPNAGSQGEYCGLLMVRGFYKARGEAQRTICLIPESAHGTNPASAALAGLKVITVRCCGGGGVDLDDLRDRVVRYGDQIAVLMVTYPSTHGVFETEFKSIVELVHSVGAQLYVDGANLNAMVGLAKIGDMGADLCHFNLHKTFGLPHGGGGPGVGPVGVRQHLIPFLPGHPLVETRLGGVNNQAIGPICGAPWGNASLLPIAWMYLALLGSKGITVASEVAVLNANYIARRLDGSFPVLFKGENGFVAHECILDCRDYQRSCGIEVDDIAKRLMDYGFHAPTVSWPVAGTMMVEPTESESKHELDRFCDAMLAIKGEIDQIAAGQIDRNNNPLKNAPHCVRDVASDGWDRPYTRQVAAFPAQALETYKYWPAVSRIDNAYGDRTMLQK